MIGCDIENSGRSNFVGLDFDAEMNLLPEVMELYMCVYVNPFCHWWCFQNTVFFYFFLKPSQRKVKGRICLIAAYWIRFPRRT